MQVIVGEIGIDERTNKKHAIIWVELTDSDIAKIVENTLLKELF